MGGERGESATRESSACRAGVRWDLLVSEGDERLGVEEEEEDASAAMRAWAAARSASVGWESMSVVKVSWVALLVNKLGGKLGGDGWTDGGLGWVGVCLTGQRLVVCWCDGHGCCLSFLLSLSLSPSLSFLYVLCAFFAKTGLDVYIPMRASGGEMDLFRGVVVRGSVGDQLKRCR